jgi:DNA-binding NarL/FixJ family response regulator
MQWQEYLESLTPEQQKLLEQLKAGKPMEAIAKDLNLKINQVIGEWSKLYLAAQALRGADIRRG